MTTSFDVEETVQRRYGAAALRPEQALCCPVAYDDRLLAAIPAEVLAVDYGCGDPARYLRAGETVLDLGSGSGKSCFIAAQTVGPTGQVIGVELNPDMLHLARRHQPTVATRIGYDNVRFVRARIQDLASDLAALDDYVRRHPIASADDLDAFDRWREEQRRERPLVADASVDVVVSNCVLNLVRDRQKQDLFAEIFRVLRPSGRAVIADIVADEPLPPHLKEDPDLWSGCIAGALEERALLATFEAAGFHGMEILARADAPWRVVEGIEFRSLTVAAYKGKQGPCWERRQAVLYRGPWREVCDDDGHRLLRGVPMAVCEKTYRLYSREPYARDIIGVPPRVEVPPDVLQPFDCARDAIRSPRETKGDDYRATTAGGAPCCPGGSC